MQILFFLAFKNTAAFKAAQTNLPSGKLAYIAEERAKLFTLSSADAATDASYRSSIAQQTASLRNLDSLRQAGISVDMAQYNALVQQKATDEINYAALMQSSTAPNIANGFYSGTNPSLNTLVQQWAAATAGMAAILDAASPNFQTHLGNVLTALQNIATTQPYEQAWKTLKIREIKDLMGIAPSASEQADLVNIAYASQSTHGAAVRQAWQYMPACERFALVAPNENTGARGTGRDALTPSKDGAPSTPIVGSLPSPLGEGPGVRLQPNPANDAVQITLPKPANGQWSLINATGNIVRSGAWQEVEPSMRLETTALPTGLYFYVFRPQQGVPLVQKLVIAR